MIRILPGMDPFEIQANLKRNGVTQKMIAESLDPEVRPATVSQIINRKAKSARIQRRIASLQCATYEQVWGEPDPIINTLST